MGRRIPEEELAALKDKAAAMRAAGVGAARIAKELGIGRNRCNELLRDVPKPASLSRPLAKDEHRAAAVALRREGRTYDEIQAELGVSKGSLSLWLRDLASDPAGEVPTELVPPPAAETARALRLDGWLIREIAEELDVSVKTAHTWTKGLPIPARATHGRSPEETAAMNRARWDLLLAARQKEREVRQAEAAARVGTLTDHELDLVAATVYWCEGAKSKPWARREHLVIINSDPGVVLVWVEWLARRAVTLDRCRLCVNIHESADLERAHQYWAELLGVPRAAFAPPTLKRHNPRTVRKNTGDVYVGCLVIATRQSRKLYQEIEGIWRGIVDGRQHADTAD